MQAFRAETTLAEDGKLTLTGLPFHAGDRIEVIVIGTPRSASAASRYPLRGQPVHYQDPTGPVAQEDWEALP